MVAPVLPAPRTQADVSTAHGPATAGMSPVRFRIDWAEHDAPRTCGGDSNAADGEYPTAAAARAGRSKGMDVPGPLQSHPLAEYVGRIDPARVYTVRELAEVMELAPSSVSGMARYGWLPGSRINSHRGSRAYTWTGQQLLLIAGRPISIHYDHERYTPSTLYRVGCRCPICVQAHSADSLARKRALADETFTAEQRARLIGLVAQRTPVADAAAKVGVTLLQVYGRANWDAGFAEEIDEAAWGLCVLGQDDPRCSTPSGYRGNPHGDYPRPACRATGCREWRRGQSRLERTAPTIA